MDSNAISPSWVEHCEKLVPGMGFVNFYAEDNAASVDRDFLELTLRNLQRLNLLQFGPFASLLAFDDSLGSFLDTFLRNRERMSLNSNLFSLDRMVFSTFYRFACHFPSNLHFTPGSRASSLLQLNVLTPERLIRIVALYYRPGSESGPVKELVVKWLGMFPQVRRELLKEWQQIVLPSAWRGLAELINLDLDLVTLQRYFNQVATNASDRSNLLACALHVAKQSPQQFALVLKSSFSPHLLANDDFRALGKEFNTELLPCPLRRDEICTLDVDVQAIFYKENEPAQYDGEEEEEQVDSNSLVNQIRDIYPHLGRYFCQRLLETFNNSVEQCIQRVMEGDLPNELLAIDFSAEQGPEQFPTLPPTKQAAATTKERFKLASTQLPAADGELKSRLLQLYDTALYNDEYDDSMEGGTTGEGGRWKPVEEAESEEQPQLAAAPPPRKRSQVPTKPEFRPMTKPMEQSVVDVNGERRNAQGKLVEEDVLMRPNLNHQTSAPVAKPKAAPTETEEQKQARIKRERARKTQQGNRERRRGDDKKKSNV